MLVRTYYYPSFPGGTSCTVHAYMRIHRRAEGGFLVRTVQHCTVSVAAPCRATRYYAHSTAKCCVDMPPPPPPPRPTAQTVLVHAVLCFVRPAPRPPRYVTMGGKASPLVGHLPHCMAWRTWRLGPPPPFTTPLSKKSTVISHIPSTPVVRDTCSDCSTILPTSRPRKQATKDSQLVGNGNQPCLLLVSECPPQARWSRCAGEMRNLANLHAASRRAQGDK